MRVLNINYTQIKIFKEIGRKPEDYKLYWHNVAAISEGLSSKHTNILLINGELLTTPYEFNYMTLTWIANATHLLFMLHSGNVLGRECLYNKALTEIGFYYWHNNTSSTYHMHHDLMYVSLEDVIHFEEIDFVIEITLKDKKRHRVYPNTVFFEDAEFDLLEFLGRGVK